MRTFEPVDKKRERARVARCIGEQQVPHEEIAFRGLIQSQLRRALGTREAIFTGAILFSIIHVSVFSGIYLFALGLVLGVLRHRSRSLLPGIGLHFFHNFAILTAEYYSLWTSPGNS